MSNEMEKSGEEEESNHSSEYNRENDMIVARRQCYGYGIQPMTNSIWVTTPPTAFIVIQQISHHTLAMLGYQMPSNWTDIGVKCT